MLRRAVVNGPNGLRHWVHTYTQSGTALAEVRPSPADHSNLQLSERRPLAARRRP